MVETGIWILMTFSIYYILMLITNSRNVFGCLVLAGILSLGIVLAFDFTKKEATMDTKYSSCVNGMIEAIPDPNDTEERSKFLEECYEK